MESLAAEIVTNGAVLILFGEVPLLGATPTGCERLSNLFVPFCNRHYFKRSEALNKLNYTSEVFLKLSQKYRDNVVYIDVPNAFCPRSKNYCLNTIGDLFLYIDDNHLNYDSLGGRKKFFDKTKSILASLKLVFAE